MKPIKIKAVTRGTAIQIVRDELTREGIAPSPAAVQVALCSVLRTAGFVLHTHAELHYNPGARRYYLAGFTEDGSDLRPYEDRAIIALRSAAADPLSARSLTLAQRLRLVLDAYTHDTEVMAFTLEEIIRHVRDLGTGETREAADSVFNLYGRSMDSELAGQLWDHITEAVREYDIDAEIARREQ